MHSQISLLGTSTLQTKQQNHISFRATVALHAVKRDELSNPMPPSSRRPHRPTVPPAKTNRSPDSSMTAEDRHQRRPTKPTKRCYPLLIAAVHCNSNELEHHRPPRNSIQRCHLSERHLPLGNLTFRISPDLGSHRASDTPLCSVSVTTDLAFFECSSTDEKQPDEPQSSSAPSTRSSSGPFTSNP